MQLEHTVEEECPEWQIAIASIVAGAKTNGTSVNETTRQILEVVTSLHHSHTEEVEQARREERIRIANALVDALPTGTIDAFEIIKAIKKFQEELLNT